MTEPRNYLLRRHFAGTKQSASDAPVRLSPDATRELSRQQRLAPDKPQEILLTHQCANHALVLNIAVYLQVQHFSVRVHHLATTAGEVLLAPVTPVPDDGVLMVLLDGYPVPENNPSVGYLTAAVKEFGARHGGGRMGVFPVVDTPGVVPPHAHPLLHDLPLVSPNGLPAFVRGWRRGKGASD